MARPLLTSLLVVSALLLTCAGTAHADQTLSCVPLTASGVDAFSERLMAATSPAECELEGISTNHELSLVRWSHDGLGWTGETYIAPNGCLEEVSYVGRQLSIQADSEFQKVCAQTWQIVQDVLAHDLFQEAPAQMRVSVDEHGERDRVGVDPEKRQGDENTLIGAARVVFGGGLLLIVIVLFRRRRQAEHDKGWRALMVAGFLAALAVRLAVQPSLANWYTMVLPAEGAFWARFGPGILVVQEAIRALLPWNDGVWFGFNTIVGALAIPLFVGLLRTLGVDRRAASVAALFFILTPLHVRISASASEQVVASTALIGAMWAWSAGVRNRDPWPMALGLALAAATALTRVDMFFQAATLPLWAFACPQLGRDTVWRRGVRGSASRLMNALAQLIRPLPSAGIFWAVWAAVGWFVYRLIVVPAEHGGADWETMKVGLRDFLVQFWEVAVAPPHWVSPLAVALACVGAAYLIRRRRGLLVAILVFLLAAFVPVSQDLRGDELLSGRYFLVTLPVFHIASGLGLLTLLWIFKGRRTERIIWILALFLIAGGTVAFVNAAYEQRFTFQDEYDFLDRELENVEADCVVAQIQIRAPEIERDLDCCLWSPLSPLVIAHPEIRFVSIAEPSWLTRLFETEECVLYYESSICGIDQENSAAEGIVSGYHWVNSLCGEILNGVRWVPVAEETITAHATKAFFAGDTVQVRLLRLAD